MVYEWAFWRRGQEVRRCAAPWVRSAEGDISRRRQIIERGSLEIRPTTRLLSGLATEWARWNGQRPFVGALTMELTPGGDDVAAWLSAGTPPIFLQLRRYAGEIVGRYTPP